MEVTTLLSEIDAVAVRVARAKTAAEMVPASQACDPLRQKARAALAERVPEHRHDRPARYAAAMSGSTADVAALDEEVGALRRALQRLDVIERNAYERHEELRKQEVHAALPKAIRNELAQVKHLRETMAAFDAACTALQATYLAIAEAMSLLGVECPWNDDRLAERLELQHQVWAVRVLSIPHNVPRVLRDEQVVPSTPRIRIAGEEQRFPKSWPLIYVRRGDAIAVRRPPSEQPAFSTLVGD